MKKVIITGSQGQDGVLLRQLLQSQGIEVIGFSRPNSTQEIVVENYSNEQSAQDFRVDLGNFEECLNAVGLMKPDTIFHLAAEHAPGHIMKTATWAANRDLVYRTHVLMTENFVKSILETKLECQLIVAGSSRMYTSEGAPLLVNEKTATKPIDFYGTTKVEAWRVLRDFREKYGLALKMAILFNHESKLRKSGYLFNDLATQLRMYISGEQNFIVLRDPDFKGDWHAAKDTITGLQVMAENTDVKDLVLASGISMTVREIVESYFETYTSKLMPRIVVSGDATKSGNNNQLIGDPSLAESFGWIRMHTLSDVLHDSILNV